MVGFCECGNEPRSSIKCGECSLFPSFGLRTYQQPVLFVLSSCSQGINNHIMYCIRDLDEVQIPDRPHLNTWIWMLPSAVGLVKTGRVQWNLCICFTPLSCYHKDGRYCLIRVGGSDEKSRYAYIVRVHCRTQPLLVTDTFHTAVAQWLRCCATNRKVAGTIPAGVSGFSIDIKSFRSHYGLGVDSASNRNEYQEYFLGVKAAGLGLGGESGGKETTGET